MRVWGSIVHLPFLLRRELHPTLNPVAPSCCWQIFQTAASVLGLSGTGGARLSSTSGRSQPPRVLRLSLVSSSVNHQNPVQCVLMFPEQISRARYAEFLVACPLPTPFLFLPPVGWDGGRAWVLLHHSFATLPFLCHLSSLGIGGLFCSLRVIF